MTDVNTLLQAAERCRRMAARCASEAIAKKFEALARDYEEHARHFGRAHVIVDMGRGQDLGRGRDGKTDKEADTPALIEPSTPVT